MGQGLLFPVYYDVDNDNDGVPDGEDPDDDNNGVLDEDQEILCFTGEEQSVWDHDNDGILNWADDDWDADGIVNTLELNSATPFISLGITIMMALETTLISMMTRMECWIKTKLCYGRLDTINLNKSVGPRRLWNGNRNCQSNGSVYRT